ncbi:CRAL/TRIO domain-containing protein [Amniculicola lignicola CBS 123094]|uniref:Phosphatidylinositol transfer protein SFH5 n=1 Tax=Amniculicola lignicola CBS 123094 TaxID=1392246 RepID=A0A6A5WLL9_9PLEO|nr:CRAL/TRIO domain-containing protein [Amniculicola lignicola CBS 123094]
MSSQPGVPSTGNPGAPGAGVGMEAKEFLEKHSGEPAPTATAAQPEADKEEPVATTEPAVTEEKEPAAPTATSAPEKPVEGNSEDKELSDSLAKTTLTPDPAPTTSTDGSPVWPEISPTSSLHDIFEGIDSLTEEAGHNEIYGITLSKDKPFHTKLIIQKFLRANEGSILKARQQLLDTLKWRKEFNPIKAMGEAFDKSRFGGLGYIVELEDVPGSLNKKDICTFNVYGAISDPKKAFGDLDGFLRWRVGLMERSVQRLGLGTATKPIPDYQVGPDPYKGFQVHDYLSVSFLRMDSATKAASKKTIEVFGRYYPETLDRKYFVNVPVIMGWLFAAMKLFVAKETQKKFTVLSYGNTLVTELGISLPTTYGGAAEELDVSGEQLKLEVVDEVEKEEDKKEEPKEEVKKDETKI